MTDLSVLGYNDFVCSGEYRAATGTGSRYHGYDMGYRRRPSPDPTPAVSPHPGIDREVLSLILSLHHRVRELEKWSWIMLIAIMWILISQK